MSPVKTWRMDTKTVFIAGAGGIGKATGIILAHSNHLDCNLIVADRFERAAKSAEKYIKAGKDDIQCVSMVMPESGSNEQLNEALQQSDIILDCLPGSEAPRLAKMAHQFNCHYANLTEYVKETEEIIEIAKGSDRAFLLQTGLAPGYINVLAMHLFNKFTTTHQVEQVGEISMKVGALSKHATSPHFYAFTWSPIGVATEYVKDAYVVEDFNTIKIPSLSRTESLLIDGVKYEDDFTSGGAADLPLALSGKVKNLNYKTIRYPGHYDWARQVIQETPAGSDIVEHLNKSMLDQIPAVEDDVVIVYAAVKGRDQYGIIRSIEKSIKILPTTIGDQYLRAIQTTTAAPLCEAARILLQDEHRGAVLQSQLDPLSFLNGPFVKDIYGSIDA